MIAGLPWTAWLLLLVAVGLGLGLELRFYLAHRAGATHREGDDVGVGRER